jgi:hypothetical protein
MEEQKRRREEEKRTLKEKALIEDEKYLAEFKEVKKTGKGGVADPNKTAENAAKAVDPQDRPIGVAMKPAVQTVEPSSQGLGSRKGLFEPVSEQSRPEASLLSTPTAGMGTGGRPGFTPSVQAYAQGYSQAAPQSYQPTNTPYQPTNTPYQPANTSYQPANTPYQPANTPYQPVNTPYQPGNTPYQPAPYQPTNMPFPSYSDTPPSATSQNIDKYYQEIQTIRKERDKAKAEMLELREMMLKEKESRLEDMIKMLTAQAMARPGAWPYTPAPAGQWPAYPQGNGVLPAGAQVFPEAYGGAASPYAAPLLGEPLRQEEGTRGAEISFPRAAEASFPREEAEKQPMDSYLPREFSSPRFPTLGEDLLPLRKPLAPPQAGFDMMEKSMSGTSHFIDPESMQWGTTKLQASVQRLPMPENRLRDLPMDALSRQSAELGGSLPSTVEHIPIPPQENYLQIRQIPEEMNEEEDPIAAAFPSIASSEPLDQSASASVELASYKQQSADSDRPISGKKQEERKTEVVTEQPIRPRGRNKPMELTPFSPESSSELSSSSKTQQPVEALEAPPRTSTASGRNRPRTLDAFKAQPVAKVPAKRQVPAKIAGKNTGSDDLKPTPTATPKENKPSFHRLQDLRDRKKQEKPRDVLDNLQDELEKLNQQRQNASEPLNLDGSSGSQSQFESRFKLVALNELKR